MDAVRNAAGRATWILAALLLASCRPAPVPRPKALVLGFATSALTLDPYLHDEESTHTTLEHFYSRLVAFGPDLELLPDLALTWQNPSDTVWRIRIRPGVRFHDGRPLGAEDVLASIRRARELPGSRVAYYLQGVTGVRAIDDLTVDILTSGPSPVLLNRLAFVAIVPRDTPFSPITRPVGTGPYRFVSGFPGGPIDAERYERYHGAVPPWPRIRIVSLPDSRSRAEAIAAGRADAVARFPHERVDWARSQPSMRVVSRPGLGSTILGFSVRPGSPYADLRVRRAFELSIDRSSLLPEAERATSVPILQLVPAGVFGHLPEVPVPTHDAAAARRLLAEAGFPAGLDATMTLPDTAAGIGAGLSRQLAAAGIRLELEDLPQPDLYARFATDPPKLFLMSWAAGTGDASDILEALFHTRRDGLGHANRFGYSNPKLDELVDRAGRTLDPVGRREALWAAFGILREDVPAIPLLLRSSLYAIRTGLEWAPVQHGRLRAADLRPAAPPALR